MGIIIFMIYSDINIRWFNLADCSHVHYRCNPRAPLEKCHTANLVNFCPKNASKANLTTWTNIITLFMNTVKHFVIISTQKLEIIQKKVAKWINCCLLRHHFVFNFGFAGSMTLHLKSQFWMDWIHVVYFWQNGHSQDFLLIPHVWGCRLYEWMRKFIHQDIVKSPKCGQQLYHVLFKLDCEESVTECTQGKIYTI